MKKIFVRLVLLSVLGGAMPTHAQAASALPTGSQAQAQAQASAGDQLDACRQHVVQLTEQSRVQQMTLAKLRTERKTLGVSGGEVVRYKLANLDQEIREHSKQNQNIIAQIDSENRRCETLAGKAAVGNRGTQVPPPGRKP